MGTAIVGIIGGFVILVVAIIIIKNIEKKMNAKAALLLLQLKTLELEEAEEAEREARKFLDKFVREEEEAKAETARLQEKLDGLTRQLHELDN